MSKIWLMLHVLVAGFLLSSVSSLFGASLMPQFMQMTTIRKVITCPCADVLPHVALLYRPNREEASWWQEGSPEHSVSQTTVPKSRFFITLFREPTLDEFYSLTDDDISEPQQATPLRSAP
jgi:hypothetical protein